MSVQNIQEQSLTASLDQSLSRRRVLQGAATLAALAVYAPTGLTWAAEQLDLAALSTPLPVFVTVDALGTALEPGQWPGLGIARIFAYVGAYLTRPNRSGQHSDPPEGDVAERWTVSPDGLTYTFTLRHGLTFHDGTRLDAAAVVRSLTRQVNPTDPSYVAGCDMHTNYTFNRRSISAPDPGTVVIELERPDPAYLYRLFHPAAMILSPRALNQCRGGIQQSLVSAGPYRIERFVSGQQAVLTAFAGYWAERPAAAQVIIQAV